MPPTLTVIALAVAIATWAVSRRPELRPRKRRAWRNLAVAYTLLWIANALWLAYDLGATDARLLNAGRVLVLASYVPLLAGLLAFPTAPRRLAQRVALLLDLATGLVGVALLMWQLVPRVERWTVHPLGFVLENVVPAADFAVVVTIAALLYRRVAASSRTPLVLLAVGHLLSVAAGVVAAVAHRQRPATAGGWIDLLWVLSGAVTFTAPVMQLRALDAARRRATPVKRRTPQHRRTRLRDPLRFVPVVGVALGAALLLAATRPWWRTPVGVAIFGSVVITALVLARQIVALRAHERAESALAESEQRFRTLVEDLHEVVFRTDAVGRLVFLNPAWERLTGRPVHESLGRTPADILHGDDRDGFATAIRPLLEGAALVCRHEARYVTAAGDVRWVLCHAHAERDAIGAVVGMSGTLVDVTGRHTLEEELRHRAFHDALTGLTNRALFRERLERALTRMRRDDPDGPAVVLFLDLDGFKEVNDRFGHAAGDAVLVAIGNRLVAATRGSDSVARFGGDEFAILLEHGPSDADVALVVDRVLAGIGAPLPMSGEEVRVGASVGVVRATAAEDVDALLRRADDAMYVAKREGKGRSVTFHA